MLNKIYVESSGKTIINNGLIVGFGYKGNANEHTFLLTPIPEHWTFALLGIAAISLITFKLKWVSVMQKVNR